MLSQLLAARRDSLIRDEEWEKVMKNDEIDMGFAVEVQEKIAGALISWNWW